MVEGLASFVGDVVIAHPLTGVIGACGLKVLQALFDVFFEEGGDGFAAGAGVEDVCRLDSGVVVVEVDVDGFDSEAEQLADASADLVVFFMGEIACPCYVDFFVFVELREDFLVEDRVIGSCLEGSGFALCWLCVAAGRAGVKRATLGGIRAAGEKRIVGRRARDRWRHKMTPLIR